MDLYLITTIIAVLIFGISIGYIYGRYITTVQFSDMMMKDNEKAQKAIDESYILGVKHGKEQALKETKGE